MIFQIPIDPVLILLRVINEADERIGTYVAGQVAIIADALRIKADEFFADTRVNKKGAEVLARANAYAALVAELHPERADPDLVKRLADFKPQPDGTVKHEPAQADPIPDEP